jgi:Immunity protein 17
MNPSGLIFIAIGLFAICGAGFDWDWFMTHRKAQLFTSLFGRSGARAFYCLLGAGLLTFGVLVATGVAQYSQ